MMSPTTPTKQGRPVDEKNRSSPSGGVEIEEEASAVRTITGEQIGMVMTTLNTVAVHDGSLLDCRKKLQGLGMYESSGPVNTKGLTLPEDEDVTDHHRDHEEAKAEFVIQEDEVLTGPIDWSADMDDVLEEDEANPPGIPPTMNPTDLQGTSEGNVQSIPPELEQFFMRNFSLLYTSLKQGIDATMASSMEIKSLLLGLTSEIKLVRDEQIKVGSRLGDLSSQLEVLQKQTQEGQFDLQEVRQEISICTASFSKINSALLQMNAANIPQGALPNIANYHFESNPTLASAKEKIRTTPLAYTREKLGDLLKKTSMPADKVDIMVTMLENRTARSFSMLLPQLNQYTSVSDDDARQLIQMVDIKTPEDLKKAFTHLYNLLNKPGQSDITAPPVDPLIDIRPSEQVIQNTRTPRIASTRVKKCENPFGLLKKK